jgi:hypothetical protein
MSDSHGQFQSGASVGIIKNSKVLKSEPINEEVAKAK